MKIVIEKVSFGRTLKNQDFEEQRNVQFRDPKLVFEAISKTKIVIKYILDHSGVIPAQFPYKII